MLMDAKLSMGILHGMRVTLRAQIGLENYGMWLQVWQIKTTKNQEAIDDKNPFTKRQLVGCLGSPENNPTQQKA